MGRAAAAAVAQAQQNISHQESLELVKCLLRVSIFHVSYLRGIFPEDKFHGVDMKNLDGMHIKMLKPGCDESQRLVDWVEKGVADALEQGYLKSIFFGIAEDPEGVQLLEEYVFSFTYGDSGVSMGFAANILEPKKSGKFSTKNNGATVNSVRYQVIRLMRMLVQICQTLDKIPNNRYIFMKLTYHDNTPADYEPPCFLPLDDNSCGRFTRKPFSMHIGTVDTDHHNVALRIKSVLDACEGPEGQLPEAEGAGSQQMSDVMDADYAAAHGSPSGQEDAALEDAAEHNHQLELSVAAALETLHGNSGRQQQQQADDTMTEATEASARAVAAAADDDAEILGTQQHLDKYKQVQTYCQTRSVVHFADVMVFFEDVPEEMLEGFFQDMVAAGVLQVGNAPDVYEVCTGTGQQSNDLDAQPTVNTDFVTSKLTGLSVGMGRVAVSAAEAAGKGTHEQKRQLMMDASVAGKVQSTHAGSANTAPQRVRPAELPSRGSGGSDGHSVQQKEVAHQFYFDCSQQSLADKAGAPGNKRKASFVADPIHQTQKKVKARAAPAGKAAKTRLSRMG